MYALFVLVALAAAFTAAVAATGRGGRLPDAVPDRVGPVLPDERLRPSDVADVRFALGLRGYRMDQVDAVLERLAGELGERDAEIARLRERGATPAVTRAEPAP